MLKVHTADNTMTIIRLIVRLNTKYLLGWIVKIQIRMMWLMQARKTIGRPNQIKLKVFYYKYDY
jgi:hypothetical protein